MRDELAREALAIKDQLLDALRARCADLEGERDSLKIEVERLLVSKYFTRCREGAVDHCSGCATWGDDGQGNVGGKPVHPPCSCGASWNWAKKMEAERDAAKAGEARAVEALKRIREELETIAAGKEEEVRNDLSSGESHGWGMAYLHVCRIIGNAATQPALDWLAQREREAAVRELNQLGPLGSSNQELFMVPWSEIKQRIAALTTQQPTACPRSEVRGKERFRA